ncbi:hypothetical protein M082_1312 [Bacteroides fragilis str. 3725 D9 ii]|nr:hypothetical protein M082_1312 [Bacteroides fragilis str. 3725 D9 ii]
MNQTQNQSKYYYSPRFRHFNIYRRDPDGDTKVDDAATQEEAKRKVYELNGWNYKPKNNTVKGEKKNSTSKKPQTSASARVA